MSRLLASRYTRILSSRNTPPSIGLYRPALAAALLAAAALFAAALTFLPVAHAAPGESGPAAQPVPDTTTRDARNGAADHAGLVEGGGNEAGSLPIGMTPEEETRRHEIGTYHRDTPPPPGPGIRQCAEWEPVTGALVAYPFGVPYNLLREIAENTELWVLAGSQSQENAARTALQNNGVNMGNVHFVRAVTDSKWTRDYGPQFAFDSNGDQGIVDHHYNRPRPNDDQVNYVVGAQWGIPVYGSPLIHTGGNYMCDGHHTGFSTNLVYNENPGLTHAQVDAYMYSYLGIDSYEVLPDIATSGIHHIDCWAKLLDEETILVKQVATNHPNYTRIENNVATLRGLTNAYGRPYNIARIFCGSYSGDVAAYTNSVILNGKVLVPLFGISTDSAALDTYRAHMPGYEVIGFTGSWLTDDAIHCRVMGIHDKYMLRVDVAPLPDTIATPGDVRLEALIDDRSEAGLKGDSLRVYWRLAGQTQFQSVPMTAMAAPDSFYADIPAQSPGSRVEYYVFAADHSNRRSSRPPVAPAGVYSYFVDVDPAAVAPGAEASGIVFASGRPSPFREGTDLSFRLPRPASVRLTVSDIQGRQIAVLADGRRFEAGTHTIRWDVTAQGSHPLAAGIYLVRLQAEGISLVRRVVHLGR